jgi:hypothetical protein
MGTYPYIGGIDDLTFGDELLASGKPDGGLAGSDVEPGQHGSHVMLSRLRRDRESPGDLRVAQLLARQSEYVELARQAL